MLIQDAFEALFAFHYCYWVKMARAHLEYTGDFLDTIPS
jgi:hypothetical protein